MSDYSDYGVHPEIEALTAEHDELRRLCAELLGACRDEPATSSIVAARLDELDAVMAQHTEREQNGLFATLRRVAVGDDYLTRFHHDHSDLISGLAEVRTDHARAPAFVQRLEAHMLIEENDMFHGAHQLLSADDWAEIEQAVATG